MAIIVKEYIRADQSNPFRQWSDGLDRHAAGQVAKAIIRMAQGNTSNIKPLGGISEYVIDWGPGYRIYLAQEGSTIIILFGGARNAANKRISTGPDCCTRNISSTKKQEAHHDIHARCHPHHHRTHAA